MRRPARFVLLAAPILVLVAGILVWNHLRQGPRMAGQDSHGLEHLFQELGIFTGKPAAVPENIRFNDLKGNAVSLSDFKGKVVFLNFWATWCPPCRNEMPAMEKLHRSLKSENFAMLAVGLKEPGKKIEDFFKKRELSFTALIDPTGEAAHQFGIASIPTTFIVNKNGELIGKAIGPRDWEGKTAVALFTLLSRMSDG